MSYLPNRATQFVVVVDESARCALQQAEEQSAVRGNRNRLHYSKELVCVRFYFGPEAPSLQVLEMVATENAP